MSWYLDKHWKRLLNSFREDFFDEFKDQVANIRKIAQEVKDQVGHLQSSASNPLKQSARESAACTRDRQQTVSTNGRNAFANERLQAQLGQSAELRTTRLAIEDARLAASGQERATAEIAYHVRKLEERSSQEEQRLRLLTLEEPERMKTLSNFIATHIVDLLGEQVRINQLSSYHENVVTLREAQTVC